MGRRREERLIRGPVASALRRPGPADLDAFDKPAKHAARGSAQSLSKAPFYRCTSAVWSHNYAPAQALQGHTRTHTSLAGSMIASSIGRWLPQTRGLIAY
ncbi:hypothetical protein NPX13_g3668 [Xylaria arbuscula]|uniref:Uncharacterized protein n=1 Tax=Xylaria arbuscula TaxID=114810 RepID=A0A9W8NHG2_9PEZI|nr:hypothetical protein NPX13_g3668 [Xylaria arbuscula]